MRSFRGEGRDELQLIESLIASPWSWIPDPWIADRRIAESSYGWIGCADSKIRRFEDGGSRD